MPQPNTATVCPPPSSAPRCAAASIPVASPLVTTIPAAESVAATVRANLARGAAGAARTDDGELRRRERREPAMHEQEWRRARDFTQQGRVGRRAVNQDVTVGRRSPGQGLLGRGPVARDGVAAQRGKGVVHGPGRTRLHGQAACAEGAGVERGMAGEQVALR